MSKTRVRWKTTYRLQPARFPPVAFFERISSQDDQVILNDLERLTDQGARQAIGKISLVPPSKRVFGPGSSALMGPFTRASKDHPSRFTDGSYGVYYAGRTFETALREVAFHRGQFHAKTKDPTTRTTFKTIQAEISKMMHDIRKGDWQSLLNQDPSQYELPQSLAMQLRESGSNGIVYPSVRHIGGECIGAFWPNVLTAPKDGKRVTLKWDGKKIVSWFDFDEEEWTNL